MSEYEVEKNIPIARAMWGQTYPFEGMEINDSFSFPIDKYRSVSTYSWRYAKRHNVKFSIRKQDDKTARIWRIK